MTLLCRTLLLGGVGVLAVTGCQRTTWTTEGQVHETAYVSPAWQLRQWETSTVTYASGDVEAGPTLMGYAPSEDSDPRLQRLSGTPIFLGNVVMMPVEAVKRSPWSTQVSTGVQLPPTHSAMPLLPESQQSGLLVEPPAPATPVE